MRETKAPAPPTGGAYLRVVAVAAAIGIPAALLAALFLALVHVLQHWLWEALPDALGAAAPPWYLVVGLPVVGAGIVFAARTLPPGLVAAAVGYLIFVGFGTWGGLDAPGLAEPGLPLYQGTIC